MMQALQSGWDFFQNEVLGMKWLNRLIGSAVEACGLDPAGKVGEVSNSFSTMSSKSWSCWAF